VQRERLEIAGQQAVDQIEPAVLWWRRIEDVEPAERRRRYTQEVVEHIDEQKAGEERRQ
jgi:hypothetical protein